MPLPQYAAGVGFFLPTMAAIALSAWLLLRKGADHLAGAPRVLAYALIFTATLLVVHLLPLAVGALTRGTVLIAALALALAAWLLRWPVPRADPVACPEGATADPEGTIARRESAAAGLAGGAGPRASETLQWRAPSTVIAALAVACVTVYELARLRGVALTPPADIDVMNFHLPGVARWIQSGSLWQIDQLLPLFPTGYYPNSGEAVTLAPVLPWRAVMFARYVEVPYFALTGIAVHALACQLGARRTTATTMAAALLVIPAVSDYALEALPDIILLFALGAGTLFLVRHGASRRRSELVLGGLGLGIAFGTKWYGVTSVVALLVAWALIVAVAAGGLRRVVRDGAMLVATVVVTGGIWIVRNIVESGNPVYPQKVSVLGLQLFPAPQRTIVNRVGFTVLGYLDRPAILRHYIVPALRTRLGLGGFLFAVGLVAAVALAVPVLRRMPRRPSLEYAMVGIALAAAFILFLWAATPGSAFGLKNRPVQAFTNVRWLAPAPLLAATLTAAVAARLGRLRLAVEVLGLAAVIDGIHRGPDVSAGSALLIAAVLALLLAAAWLAIRGTQRLPRAARSTLALGAPVAAVLALAPGGWRDERRFLSAYYTSEEPPVTWIEQHAPGGHRIGLAGIWSVNGISPAFPVFGPRLRNRVDYVGPHVAGQVLEYVRRQPFDAAVLKGGYDLLLIGRGQPPLPQAVEEGWARSLGFTLVSASPRLALYRSPGSPRQAR